MTHNAETEAHAYFYEGVAHGKTKEYARCNLWYSGCTAYSYNTAIALVVPARGFDRADPANPSSGVCLLSSTKMSVTTAKHITTVFRACPFSVTAAVPMSRAEKTITPGTVAWRMESELEFLAGRLERSDSRKEFVRLMDARDRIIKFVGGEWEKALRSCGRSGTA